MPSRASLSSGFKPTIYVTVSSQMENIFTGVGVDIDEKLLNYKDILKVSSIGSASKSADRSESKTGQGKGGGTPTFSETLSLASVSIRPLYK